MTPTKCKSWSREQVLAQCMQQYGVRVVLSDAAHCEYGRSVEVSTVKHMVGKRTDSVRRAR